MQRRAIWSHPVLSTSFSDYPKLHRSLAGQPLPLENCKDLRPSMEVLGHGSQGPRAL